MFKMDDKDFQNALKAIALDPSNLLHIEGAGAAVIANNQKMLVPVKSSATKTSIRSHIVSSSAIKVVDDIGPETDYAPYIEYGTGEYAEGGGGRKGGWVYKGPYGFRFTLGMKPQPFVRPSAFGNNKKSALNAISSAFSTFVVTRWP